MTVRKPVELVLFSSIGRNAERINVTPIEQHQSTGSCVSGHIAWHQPVFTDVLIRDSQAFITDVSIFVQPDCESVAAYIHEVLKTVPVRIKKHFAAVVAPFRDDE